MKKELKRKLIEQHDREFPGAPGRKKGIPNKVTTEFRDTVRKLLEDNTENITLWLQLVAAENPGKALDLITKLAEYAAPKLMRTEIAGDKDNPLTIQHIQRTIVDSVVTIEQDLTEVKNISSKVK